MLYLFNYNIGVVEVEVKREERRGESEEEKKRLNKPKRMRKTTLPDTIFPKVDLSIVKKTPFFNEKNRAIFMGCC